MKSVGQLSPAEWLVVAASVLYILATGFIVLSG